MVDFDPTIKPPPHPTTLRDKRHPTSTTFNHLQQPHLQSQFRPPQPLPTMPSPNPFLLAADNNVSALLPLLQSTPSLVHTQDAHGYSLLHAAASYNHASLLRQLVRDFGGDVNVRDEDGETPLFQTETVEMARVLVEELGARVDVRNHDGWTAAEKLQLEAEGDGLLVAAYLRQVGRTGDDDVDNRPTPALPANLSINITTVQEQEQRPSSNPEHPNDTAHDDDNDVLDPDFKARIDQLAARPDFHSPDAQKELRDLVTEAVRGHVVGPAAAAVTREQLQQHEGATGEDDGRRKRMA